MAARLCGILWLVLGACPAAAREFSAGPGRMYEALDRVPWETLRAGDTVLIHWREQPYRAKWIISARGAQDQPITVRGVPGPLGQLPVIDGASAITRPALNFWSEERGVIIVGASRSVPNLMPAHIVIEGLEVRGARPGRNFVGRSGIAPYSDAASAVFVESGEHITVRNCVLHDSANGFFTAHETREITIEGCHVHDNGIEDSIYQHNAYTESAGMVYQFNRFGPLRAGCRGNNIKDRSAGLVIRDNWIEGGNRQLDLVDVEEGVEIRRDPRYDRAFVYGNVLIEPDGDGNNQLVHFGGDNGPEEHFRKVLHFFNNTVVSRRGDPTTLLRLSSNVVSADVRNNILYVTAPGRLFAILDESGLVRLEHNWIKPGWSASHGALTGIVRANASNSTDDPGFVDENANDFRLRSDSACVNAGSDQLPGGDHGLRFEFAPPHGGKPRPAIGPVDLGAFEFVP